MGDDNHASAGAHSRDGGGSRRHLDKLKTEGPTAVELKTTGLEFDFVSGLQSNLESGTRRWAGYHNDPVTSKTEYQKMLAVTPADVKRVANKYLTKGRVVLSIVPMGQLNQASKPAESKPYRRVEE
jgi:predicted Zn-dependent peptidase